VNRTPLILAALLACAVANCTSHTPPKPDTAYGRGGQRLWVDVPQGRLKAEAYSSTQLSAHPVLVVALHGDLPDPTPSYQYAFAQLVTQGPEAAELPPATRARLADWTPLAGVVTVGLLRPGYTDNAGDRSDGDMGHASLDNFTPEVVDAVAQATNSLKLRFSARRVVLVGHSGGAVIVADLLGRHPEAADAALLVACGCDPEGVRARMRQTRGSPIWKGPTRSLQPLGVASTVRTDVIVRLVVGANDDIALPELSVRYAEALKKRGVDAKVTIVPAVGHNILLTMPVLVGLADLIHMEE
jgi:predicted esterase